MDILNEQLLEAIIGLVILVVTTVLLPAVRQWLQARLDTEKYDMLVQFINRLVEAAQQKWQDGETSNQEKKMYVQKQAAAYAERIGIKVSPAILEALIEGAVFGLKQWNNNPISGIQIIED